MTEAERESPVPKIAQVGAAIVAPTSLVTSVLYYFGWSHAYWYYNEFGVNSTALGFTTTDYFQRSVDALFIPVTAAAVAGLLALWAHGAWQTHVAPRLPDAATRRAPIALGLLGLLLAGSGLVATYTTTWLSEWLAAAPLSLCAGVLLIAYARWMRPRPVATPYRKIAEWTVAFVLVAIGLFWAAGDYSAAVGTSRAHGYIAGLSDEPDLIVFSARSLSLSGPGIRETTCQDSDATYRIRYDGLKLNIRSGDQYVLLPRDWNGTTGTAILLPVSAPIRLEFARPGNRVSPAC